MSLLDERVQRATALLPPSHRLLPRVKEVLFPTQNDAKTRYQDWAFTHGFAIVVEKNDLKNGVYILDCSRHRKDTKNTRKKVDWVRPASKINDALQTDRFGFVLRGKKIARYGSW